MGYQLDFINSVAPHAQRAGNEYGVLPSLIVGQAIHESNWGRSGLAVKGLNLFGVKGSYEGRSIMMKTWEVYSGKSVYVDAYFRKYPSWYESILDLVDLYKNGLSREKHNRYAAVLNERDHRKAAHAVANAGYATDPKYANKVIATIEYHNLTRFDEGTPADADKGGPKDSNYGYLHVVVSGDTLGAIASKYGKSVDYLQKLNGIPDANKIYPGQRIKLQGTVAEPAKVVKDEYQVYTVKSGDALSLIAKKFGTTTAVLAALNDIENVNLIQVGQKLRIPAGEAKAAPKAEQKAIYHTVKSGDIVSRLAVKYGSSTSQIKAWNKLRDVNKIYPGQKLRVK
jgi:LysM repeat protein